jgi:hypothetical protein
MKKTRNIAKIEPRIGDMITVTWQNFFPITAIVVDIPSGIDTSMAVEIVRVIFLEGGIDKGTPDKIRITSQELNNHFDKVAFLFISSIVSPVSREM